MTTYDLRRAILGSSTPAAPVGASHSFSGDNNLQLIRGPQPDQFLLCKGFMEAPCRFEELRFLTVNGVGYIARGWDTSDRPDVYRLTEPKQNVSLWCPASMNEGNWFRREATVTRYRYSDGAMVESPKTHVTWLRLKKVHASWTSSRGVTVQDVAELTVHDGEDGKSKPPFETYYFSNGRMVGWRDHNGGRATDINFDWSKKPQSEWPLLRAEPLPMGWNFQPTIPQTTPPAPVDPPPPREHVTERRIRSDIQAKVRQGPSTATAEMPPRLLPNTVVRTVRTVEGLDGDGFDWHERLEGGYVRADLFTDYAAPQPTVGKLAAPLTGYSIESEHGAAHHGYDLAAPLDTPIVATGTGQVAFLYTCSRCTADKPNFASMGLTTAQRQAALSDPAYGYGYGNAVIVRYDYKDLPDSARAELDRLGLRDGYVYVIHGHMKQVNVKAGECVGRDKRLGTVGNTGNSSGPHLHLEARASMNANETSLYNRTLIDPKLIFNL